MHESTRIQSAALLAALTIAVLATLPHLASADQSSNWYESAGHECADGVLGTGLLSNLNQVIPPTEGVNVSGSWQGSSWKQFMTITAEQYWSLVNNRSSTIVASRTLSTAQAESLAAAFRARSKAYGETPALVTMVANGVDAALEAGGMKGFKKLWMLFAGLVLDADLSKFASDVATDMVAGGTLQNVLTASPPDPPLKAGQLPEVGVYVVWTQWYVRSLVLPGGMTGDNSYKLRACRYPARLTYPTYAGPQAVPSALPLVSAN